LIVRLGHVPFMDVTGLQTLDGVIDDFHKRGVRVMLTEVNARVRRKLEKMQLISKLGAENLTDSLELAVARSVAS